MADRVIGRLKAGALIAGFASLTGLAGFAGLALPAAATPNPLGQATEFTQLRNEAELIKRVGQGAKQIGLQGQQLTQQINLVAGQLKAYRNMVLNTVSLPAQVWGNVKQSIGQLRSTLQQAQTVAASGAELDTLLRSRMAGDPLYTSSPLDMANYAARYDAWTKASQNALNGTLSASNLTVKDVGTEEALIKTMQSQAATATGRMQALQIANELAASSARQIASLRALTAAQNAQTSLYQARVLARMNAGEAARRKEAAFPKPDFGHWDLMQQVMKATGKNR